MKKVIQLKEQSVNEFSETLKSSQSFIVFEYIGLDADESCTLRKKLHDNSSKMLVLKNNILNRSLEKAGISEFGELVGPNAIAFSSTEQIAPLKAVVEMMKDNDCIKIKGSVIDGVFYDAASTITIAKLPNREGMYSMFLSCLTAPIRNFLYALKAVGDKK